MTPPSLSEFTAATREYCLLAEQDEPLGTSGLWQIRNLLLRLIYHISSVDQAPQDAAEDAPETPVELRLKVTSQFSTLEVGRYWTVPDLFAGDMRNEPVTGMLSADLTDIYLDISRGLAHANRGLMQEACFDWSAHYRSRWGQIATNALMAIESYRIAHPIVPESHLKADPTEVAS